jgi:hypothetical protein
LANGNGHVAVFETEPFGRELVNVRSNVGNRISVDADGVAGHVIDGDKQHVDRRCKNSGDRKEEKGDSSRKELVHYALAVPEKSR